MISTSKGLYFGTNFERLIVKANDGLNTAVWGATPDLTAIAAGPGGKLTSARPLRDLLSDAVKQAWDVNGGN